MHMYIASENGIEMWEMYEIHPSIPRKINHLGSWSDQVGFDFVEPQKWMRRKNMDVSSKRKQV